MCTGNNREGGRRSKRATRKWYERQAKGLQFRTVGMQLLLELRFVEWLRWVFVDLDHHDADCRWRKLLARLD